MSFEYINELVIAELESVKEGIDPLPMGSFPDDPLAGSAELITSLIELWYNVFAINGKEHLRCMETSSYLYTMLRLAGLPVEIVYGDFVDGSLDGFFDTSKEEILSEYHSPERVFSSVQNIHAWVHVSRYMFIDLAGYHYLKVKEWPHLERDDVLGNMEDVRSGQWNMKVKYRPMLTGIDIARRTNLNPFLELAIEEHDLLNVPPGTFIEHPFDFIMRLVSSGRYENYCMNAAKTVGWEIATEESL